MAATEGSLHSKYGVDYLVTARPGIWHRQQRDGGNGGHPAPPDPDATIDMPPFLVGVYRWDSYVLARAVLSPSIAVVDATAAVTALHLQGQADGAGIEHRLRRGATYNDRLVHDLMGKQYLMGHTNNADYGLSAGGQLLPRL